MVRISVEPPSIPEDFSKFKLYFFVQEKIAEIHANERENYGSQGNQE